MRLIKTGCKDPFKIIDMNTKKQLTMDGKTFNECWFIDEIEIKDNDSIVVNFINNIIVNVISNSVNVWSAIN